jgi:hypothetical protein
MTASTIDAAPATRETPTSYDGSRPLRYAAATALVAGPLLWAAGMFTSPENVSMADTDYISSLARDFTMTEISALFLHYGNLFLGLGILAAPSLVRGRRGSRLVLGGSLLAAVGLTNMSGMILADWWNASAGTLLPIEQAAEVFAMVKSAPLLPVWNGTELFCLVGPLLLLAGLARAGVLGWYTLALMVGGVVGLVFVPGTLMAVAALAVLVGFSPFALIGMRLLQRLRVEG